MFGGSANVFAQIFPCLILPERKVSKWIFVRAFQSWPEFAGVPCVAYKPYAPKSKVVHTYTETNMPIAAIQV